ncbi:major facilitator superfamily domain-containing protein [Mycotypha africana]|uniref:major facilitator superfamily domain-containing protein n=1 Tax=Mycotypha africana TaxID=64632 RepID=UPI0022FFDE6C|nr:major facilitator superfamily domain-containing protein [Mycotypha africana]KAI8967285.1 major facilitator superfamily domain-containing protein [Mycotypha africana]
METNTQRNTINLDTQHYPSSSQLNNAHQNLASLEALDRKDNRKTRSVNWFMVRTILTSGAGFFTDSYDVFIINLVMPMIGFVYYPNNNNKIPSDIEGIVKGMASVGTLLGQLFFGFMGDIFGRKIYGFELLIIIIGTINCATAASAIKGVSMLGFLGFWRFILGIGIGGDYPMSATITSEWSSAGRRGMMMALIFSMQGIGMLAAAIVTIILLAIFKSGIETDTRELDYVWRLCIGLGAVPAFATVYLRFTMPESPRYSLDVKHDVEQAAIAMTVRGEHRRHQQEQLAQKSKSRNHWKEFRDYFKQWKHLKVLLGTSLSWFLLDIAFYGLGLNNSYVLNAIGFSKKDTPFEVMWWNAIGQLIITLLGSVPGYYLSVIFIERWGRRPIQIMGFAVCTALFIILSAAYHPLRDNSIPAFVAIFTLAQLFQNFGANTTTFIIPGEVFPTKVRASAHGISAASGKAGAILAAFAFNELVETNDSYPGEHAFLPQTLGIFAGIMFLGLIVTILWIPESKGKDLEVFEEGYVSPTGSVVTDEFEPPPVTAVTDEKNGRSKEYPSNPDNGNGKDSNHSSTNASSSSKPYIY